MTEENKQKSAVRKAIKKKAAVVKRPKVPDRPTNPEPAGPRPADAAPAGPEVQWPPADHIVGTTVRTLILAVLGCIIIVMAAPFVKAAVMKRVVAESEKLLNENKATDALARVDRFAPWANGFPHLAARVGAIRARSHYRLKDIARARDCAERTYNSCVPSVPPRPPNGLMDTGRYLREGPTWIATEMFGAGGGKAGGLDRAAGYHGILYELELADKADELEQYARQLIEKFPNDAQATAVLEFLAMPPDRRRRMRRIRRQGRFVSEKKPKSKAEIRAEKLAALRETERDLVVKINKYKDYLSGAQQVPPGVQEAYDSALAAYQEAERRAKADEEKFRNATGAERMRLMDQLHRMKGEVARRGSKLRDASDELKKYRKPVKRDPRLVKLNAELDEVRWKIGNLEDKG